MVSRGHLLVPIRHISGYLFQPLSGCCSDGVFWPLPSGPRNLLRSWPPRLAVLVRQVAAELFQLTKRLSTSANNPSARPRGPPEIREAPVEGVVNRNKHLLVF